MDWSPDGSLRDLREECSAVQWKEGQNLTVKEVRKGSKGKKGKKGKGGREEGAEEGPAKKKYKSCNSFFRWAEELAAGGVSLGLCVGLADLVWQCCCCCCCC